MGGCSWLALARQVVGALVRCLPAPGGPPGVLTSACGPQAGGLDGRCLGGLWEAGRCCVHDRWAPAESHQSDPVATCK